MNQEEFDQQFEELVNEYNFAHNKENNLTALRLVKEMKRFAKAHRQLVPYIEAGFYQMNAGSRLFELEQEIENSMELIALLESEEKAKKFQHDYDQDHYDFKVYWILPCAYHNLASNMAYQKGYNSPIVHGTVDDGLQVCRKVGNQEAPIYFREFAVEACIAAGDYEMGEHYNQLCYSVVEKEIEFRRLWIELNDKVRLLICKGMLSDALDVQKKAMVSSELTVSPSWARLEGQLLLEKILWLMGNENEQELILQSLGVTFDSAEIPVFEECPEYYILKVQVEAVKLVRQNQPLEAAEKLAKMERFVLGQGNIRYWFDLRCY